MMSGWESRGCGRGSKSFKERGCPTECADSYRELAEISWELFSLETTFHPFL